MHVGTLKLLFILPLKSVRETFFPPLKKFSLPPSFSPTTKPFAITVLRTDVNTSPFQLAGIYVNLSTISFRSHILLSFSDIINLSESHPRVTSSMCPSYSCPSLCSLNFCAKTCVILNVSLISPNLSFLYATQ